MPVAFNALRLRASLPIDITEDILHDLLGAGIVTRAATGRFELATARELIGDEDVRAAVGADLQPVGLMGKLPSARRRADQDV